MTCEACKETVGLMSRISLKMTGERDLDLCPDCARIVKVNIVESLAVLSMNNISKKVITEVKHGW